MTSQLNINPNLGQSAEIKLWRVDETEDDKTGSPRRQHGDVTLTKVIKTLITSLTFVVIGLFLEIAGPTLPYLKNQVGVNYEEVSRVLSIRSVGYLIGSICSGFLVDAFISFSELYFAVLLLLAAIVTGATPWCSTLSLLGVMFFCTGIAQGGLCTGINAYTIKIWKERSGPPLVSQHFGFGVGALCAPQLVKAFVKTEFTESTTVGLVSTSEDPGVTRNYSSDDNTTSIPSITVAEIEYPYVIIGVLTGLFALIYLLFSLLNKCGRKVETKRETAISSFRNGLKLISPSFCTNGHPIFGVVFFVFFTLMFMHVVGGERVMSKFLYTFAVESDLQFSPDTAWDLNSAFWLAFTIGRGVNIILAVVCPLPLLLGIEVSGNIINGLVLGVFAVRNSTILWVFTCSFGLFLSPLFPTLLVWADLYVEMTAIAVSVAYVGSAIGGMVYQWLGGYLLEYHGPPTIMQLILGYSLNLGVIYLIIQTISAKHGKRMSKMTSVEEESKLENEGEITRF